MTNFTPIVRYCDHCNIDLSIQSLSDPYPVAIGCDGLILCDVCFCSYRGIEPVTVNYEPHIHQWAVEEEEEDEIEEIQEELEAIQQLSLWG